jgi:phosphoglucosamine mutase
LGGENSGHILCCHFTTTGDAIIAALQVLMALKRADVDLDEALLGRNKCPQVLINVRYKGDVDPVKHPLVVKACDDVTAKMAGRGRVLLRKSGTEPLVRVMVEGEDAVSVAAYAEELSKIVIQVCG